MINQFLKAVDFLVGEHFWLFFIIVVLFTAAFILLKVIHWLAGGLPNN